MEKLLSEIKQCTICAEHLSHGPNPVIQVSKNSKILVIGQAPGIRVHESGIPWNDPSGKRLREWLQVTDEAFYDVDNFGILPMGFCYPGKGTSGDLPPRKECAPQWHQTLLDNMHHFELILLIGQYAQNYYLKSRGKRTLTETVKSFEAYLPEFVVLPHPSPRNGIWLKKNQWFEEEVLPELRKQVKMILK